MPNNLFSSHSSQPQRQKLLGCGTCACPAAKPGHCPEGSTEAGRTFESELTWGVQKSSLVGAMSLFSPWEPLILWINSATFSFASIIKYNSFPFAKIKSRRPPTWHAHFIFCTEKSFRKIIGLKDYICFPPWSTFLLEGFGNLCHIWNFQIEVEVLHCLSFAEGFKGKVST